MEGKIKRWNSTQVVALGFLGVIVGGSLLLFLPISWAEGATVSFIDCFFTAATSVCVTGLVTVSTAAQWSFFGKAVILVLIQLGGLGVVTCTVCFFLALKKRINLKERILIQESYNLNTLSGLIILIKRIIRFTLMIEGLGAICYSFVFIPEYGWGFGFVASIFHSVSSFCNAGIDILGDASFCEYRTNLIINLVTTSLIIIGGIGFTVQDDIYRNVKKLKRRFTVRKFFRGLTLHSQLALVVTAILLVGGTFLIFVLEYQNPQTIGELSIGEKLVASFFQATTLRTAGFLTIPQENFTNASMVLCIVLMFIGGSPAGTAGGMKTTTVGMLGLTVFTTLRGQQDTEIFRRKISAENIRTGLAVFILGLTVTTISIFALSITEPFDFLDIVYEVVSAVGTVGLSRGITADLSVVGKIIIIITMYIGRIGPTTMALAFLAKKKNQVSTTLPERRIIVG